ncbi:serine hydrolase [Aquimarina sp. 2201CG5-10]|uniref:serine hydrolase n=1 Tax=Aquimarina callyspongiae TaxID=3098150 RepID=UPI002AB3F2C3|nr:serine hydrolase [Aquimarina sp. 2201CG5-10]MDY8137879.1 serine hydrolase [Aquimarina sp. 2201CG5-10]
MKKQFTPLYILVFFLFTASTFAQSLEQKFDDVLQEKYKSDTPGATVIITKKGETIYHKAFGLANMELSVPMKTNNVFEIGSITKQFTAVSILMLLEQGKLTIEDEITKYIPDYPTHGKKITIHHLLNHTSGIKSYTSMNLSEIAAKDMTPTELIDYFKNEPMDFDPGEEWRYNNSGYIILGFIIEKVSGQTYEDFVEQNIFKPLQMQDSFYGSKSEIIKNRASGYQTHGNYINADYLSMTLPYAAGSLMSTVKDLNTWQKALNTNKLLKATTLQKAFQNTTLNNGKPTYYGYGWSVNKIGDSPSIEHGGGIFGYTSYQIYIPKEDLHVAILTNCNCNSPTDVAIQIASIAINKPYNAQKATEISAGELEKLVGVYEFEDGAKRIITLKDAQLYSQRDGGQKFEIFHKGDNVFFFKDSFSEIEFKTNDTKVTASFKNRIKKTTGKKTNKPIPSEKETIKVSNDILEQYVGVYEIRPGFDLTIQLEDGKLISQATGQGSFQIHPETETKFFVKEFAAALEFIKENGKVTKAILHQGGRQTPAKRKD